MSGNVAPPPPAKSKIAFCHPASQRAGWADPIGYGPRHVSADCMIDRSDLCIFADRNARGPITSERFERHRQLPIVANWRCGHCRVSATRIGACRESVHVPGYTDHRGLTFD
jgi:hypothetical protein